MAVWVCCVTGVTTASIKFDHTTPRIPMQRRPTALLLLVPACTSFHLPSSIKTDILREAKDAHAAEIASETAAAFLAPIDSTPGMKFTRHHVGLSYAGPDAEVLGDASADVHCSTQPVLTRAECMSLRLEAQAAMALGLSSDFSYTDVARIGEVHVADMPIARRTLRSKLETMMPMLAEPFGLSASSLRVCDAVVIRYDAAQRATRQPMHRDAALLSFNVPLSADLEYAGGGTLIEGSGEVLKPPMGTLLFHASGMRHAGNAITRGVRWVLVVFVVSTDVPQLARFCANVAAASQADAADAVDDGKADFAAEARERARAALFTAVSLSPTDYQLNHDLGGFYLAEGDTVSARRYFHRAATLYPSCPRPHGALAALLSDKGRHRAALRHYEASLDALARHKSGQDRNIALAAAVGAARCALALHERYHHSDGQVAAMVAERMEVAAGWLRRALAAIRAAADVEDEEDTSISEAEELLRQMHVA